MHMLQKSSSPSNHRAIFRAEIRIVLDKLVVDASMETNNTPALHDYIISIITPVTETPPRHATETAIVDAVDATSLQLFEHQYLPMVPQARPNSCPQGERR
jgi:hypothetical protein